jgi:hypothetical protein
MIDDRRHGVDRGAVMYLEDKDQALRLKTVLTPHLLAL